MRTTFRAALLATALFSAPAANAAEPFHFVAFGDMPYAIPAAYEPFERLLARINAADPAFSIHVGDIKSGSSECSDEVFQKVYDYFMGMEAPVFYTPGDNEWTDCHRAKAGEYDPEERLAKIRQMFFSAPVTQGKVTMEYTRQADVSDHKQMVENAIWSHEGVLFSTIHVVGSNNGLERTEASIAEYFKRDAANVDWIARSFQQAAEEDAAAVVISFQANPIFEVKESWNYENSGFKNTLNALAEGAKAFGKPVLLIHGDWHVFEIDRPLRDAKGNKVLNVTRLQVYGSSQVHAVKVTVDANDPGVFGYIPLMVKENM